MAVAIRELGAIEGRMAALLARYCDLDDTHAYAMAAAGLSDWQVQRALQYEQAGMFFTAAIYEASQDQEPHPSVLPPHITVERARRDLTAALCHFSLIRYIGGQGKDAPVVGVIVLCPGRGYRAVRYNLAPCRRLVPRSRRWRKVEEWLRIEQEEPPETLESLERDRRDLVTEPTPWRRWLRLDAPQTVIAPPRMILNRLFEEGVMGKVLGTMSDREIEDQLEQRLDDEGLIGELAYSDEAPDDHYMIGKLLPTLDLTDIRYWMARLKDSRSRHAQADRDKLKDRLIYILTIERPGLASVVKGILQDAEQVY